MSENVADPLSFSNVSARRWYRHSGLSTQTAYVAAAFVVITALVAIFAPHFLSTGNLLNTSKNFSYIAIVALGSTLVIITGGIDLSVGSVMALVAVLTVIIMKWLATTAVASVPYLGITLAVLCGLAISAFIGFVNGVLIAKVRLSPFVTTLGMLSICRGVTYVVTQGRGQAPAGPQVNTFYALTDGKLLGLPVPLVYLLVLAIIMGVVLRHTRWGRYVFVLGGNERAAKLTGVSVSRVKISVYMLCAMSAGLAGILIAGWLGFRACQSRSRLRAQDHRRVGHRRRGSRGRRRRTGRSRDRGRADRGDPQRARAVRRRYLLGAGVRRYHHHPCGPGGPAEKPRVGVGRANELRAGQARSVRRLHQGPCFGGPSLEEPAAGRLRGRRPDLSCPCGG